MIFRSFAIVTLFVLALVLFGGCEPPPAPIGNAPPLPQAPPPPPLPASDETGTGGPSSLVSPESVVSPESKEPFAPDPSFQDSSPSVRSEQPPIHLSAGVALPQLLPEGTQIGVSVDFEVPGRLRSSQYVLVIESSAGECVLPVKLSPKRGTLQEFLPLSVRPEHKPFKARIDEKPSVGQSIPASNTVALQTSY